MPQIPDPTTSSPTASETTAAPEPREEQTEDGAIAFARHWIDLLNDARLEFETEPLANASTPECATCSNYVSLIDEWQSDGTTYVSKPWRIEQVGVISSEADAVELGLRIFRPVEEITSPVGEVEKNRGTRATYAATFHWGDSGWRMHELVIPE
ncbi:DUF6318 family protein [Nocardioides sp. B-3]|uniref:DUF6318 family protein n=1 Tax=Nocardioides sp. B-3 TaxID=2895565 RepID=UPI002153398B|nr:DUF6318 family protein [Nocardioides sp. B-3]UUZ60584.1 DUF6318 family protein [Nocardioides sp. B-3]